ncbi:glucose-dependent insulinotropic receptor-like [Neodiprion pinetum]|uniref:glucose-dependent insulinotropic receptor-like n=1 Tax=Neodiprion pinetum TaxID=441929 RepID=UPI001EDD0B77|nr:5-hydroxytryptamine receptor 1A-like isoform X1 [Neodiprion pinetum]
MAGENYTTANSILQTTIQGIVFNETGNQHLNLSEVHSAKTQLKLYDIFVPILGCLIIVTNLIVVLSSGLIIKKGVSPKTTYLFLGNVAMADLVTGAAVLLGQFYPKSYRDHLSCAIQLGMIVSSTVASLYSVGLIAVDRFLYIVHGMNYNRWMYSKRARLLILFTWVVGIILGFLPATGLWTGSTDRGRICWFTHLAPPGLILLITIIGLLPILLVLVLYGIILYHAIMKVLQLRRIDRNRTNPTASRDEDFRIFRGGDSASNNDAAKKTSKNKPSKVKAVKVVMFTCGSIVLTWIPYFVACTIYVFSCDFVAGECKTLRVAIASPLAILGFLNSLFNPVIYAWWHTGFRTMMKKVLRKGRSSNSNQSCNTPSTKSSQRSGSTKSKSSGNSSDVDMHPI